MDNVTTLNANKHEHGHVYVMTHSIFSDVVRIGCTPEDTEQYAKNLSLNTPGEYHIAYSSPCESPCEVKQRVRESLQNKIYMNEFYEVSVDEAKSMVQREVMRIPSMDIH